MDTPIEPRVFVLPFQSITMSERRMMATKFAINWDAIEVEMSDIPRPADEANPTDEEAVAAAKVFTRLVGPNERFALLYVAVKRQLPAESEASILEHADRGEYVLAFTAPDDDDVTGEGAGLDPLPAPSATTSSANS